MSQRFSITLLLLAVVVQIMVQARDRRVNSLFNKIRQQDYAQASEAAAASGKFNFEHRRMNTEEEATAEATKAETDLDADMNILK